MWTGTPTQLMHEHSLLEKVVTIKSTVQVVVVTGLIGVHEMHGRVHPNYISLLQLFCTLLPSLTTDLPH